MSLSYELVRECFDYNPETGDLIWRARPGARRNWNNQFAGTIAGSSARHGYLKVSIDGGHYQAHRVVWLWNYGSLENLQVDHIDHDRRNNRVSNLRLVTLRENGMNIGLPKGNKSGVVGVRWRPKASRWHAYITVHQRHIDLGFFEKKSDAVAVRRAAEKEHGFHPNHGRSAP